MPTLFYHPDESSGAKTVELRPGISVLDTLLQSGIDVPHGCKSGVCQSCIMQSPGPLPEAAQQGLSPSQIEQGMFLACCCQPQQDLKVFQNPQATSLLSARVVDKQALSPNIFRLRIENVIDYRAGQFMTLWRDSSIARSYSIASLHGHDPFIEFHIKRIPDGAFSNWAWQSLQVGDAINVQGPLGDCFFSADTSSQGIVLAGIGTGLAPLYGICRDALQTGYQHNINLIVGGNRASDFYHLDEITTLQQEHDNLHVTFIAKDLDQQPGPANMIEGDVYTEIKHIVPSLQGQQVFLCGAETFVKKMKKQCFLSGANMRDILADAFIPSSMPSTLES